MNKTTNLQKVSAVNYFKEKGKSKYQEKVAEYAFLKDFLISAATQQKDVLMSRSDFDSFGYDIVAQEKNSDKTIQIQLKATSGKAAVWDVHKNLVTSVSGQIVLVKIKENPITMELEFTYFVLNKNRKEEIASRQPKVNHSEKCKTKRGDYIELPKNDLHQLLNI